MKIINKIEFKLYKEVKQHIEASHRKWLNERINSRNSNSRRTNRRPNRRSNNSRMLPKMRSSSQQISRPTVILKVSTTFSANLSRKKRGVNLN